MVDQWWHNPDMNGRLEMETTTSMIVWQSRWVRDRIGSLETEKTPESTRKVVVGRVGPRSHAPLETEALGCFIYSGVRNERAFDLHTKNLRRGTRFTSGADR